MADECAHQAAFSAARQSCSCRNARATTRVIGTRRTSNDETVSLVAGRGRGDLWNDSAHPGGCRRVVAERRRGRDRSEREKCLGCDPGATPSPPPSRPLASPPPSPLGLGSEVLRSSVCLGAAALRLCLEPEALSPRLSLLVR